MADDVGAPRQSDRTATRGSVEVMSRGEVMGCARWASAFAGKHKDHRYYELVEDTIQPDFEFRYFAIKDEDGRSAPFNRSSSSIRIYCSARTPGRGSGRLHSPVMASLYEDAYPDGRMRGRRRPSGRRRAIASCERRDSCGIDHGSCKGDERTADRVEGVFGIIPGFVECLCASRLYPGAEHAQHPT